MALQSSGAISLNDLHIEAGGTSGTTVSLNDADIRTLGLRNVALNGTNALGSYYGVTRKTTMTAEVIGGGGGGGYGLEDGAGSGRGGTGGDSSVRLSGEFTPGVPYSPFVSSSGALGGRNGAIGESVDRAGVAERGGDASFYGAGGQGFGNGGGENTNPGYADAPATSYGAGGGGAGGDQGDTYDGDGNAGEGGQAASKATTIASYASGSEFIVTVGAKGAGAVGGNYYGGDGAGGYVKITIAAQAGIPSEIVYTFTSSGTFILP